MTNKNLKPVGLAIIIGILAVGAYFYLQREDNSDTILGVEEVIPSQIPPSARPTPETSTSSNSIESKSGSDEGEAPSPEVVVHEPPDKEYREEQAKILKDYKSTARLEVKLPENMAFTELSLDDDMAVLYGSELSGNTSMAIFAAKKTASPETIVKFLNENKQTLPMLKDKGFVQSGNIQTITAPQGTGMGKVTLIPGQDSNGKKIWAAHIQRKDNVGSYLFLMESFARTFDSNEEGLEAMLKSMKAK